MLTNANGCPPLALAIPIQSLFNPYSIPIMTAYTPPQQYSQELINEQIFITLMTHIQGNRINDFVEDLSNAIHTHQYDINYKYDCCNGNKMPILIYAAWKGSLHYVRVIHQNGADINSLDDHSNNAMHYSVFKNDDKMTEYLQINDINFYQKNVLQKIPIQLCSFFRV